MPSFLAASVRAGVMGEGSGAAARTGEANAVAASAVPALSTSRLEKELPVMVSSSWVREQHIQGGYDAIEKLSVQRHGSSAVPTRFYPPEEPRHTLNILV